MVVVILQTADPTADIGGFLGLLRDLDVIGLLSIWIILLYRGDLKWGSDYKIMKEERDSYHALVEKYHDRVAAKLDKLEDSILTGGKQ
jgi:hypothetical protein